MVFSKMDFEICADGPQDDDDIRKAVSLAKSHLIVVSNIVSNLYPDSYPGNIFKNTERQIEIETEFNRRHGLASGSSSSENSLLDFM